MAARCRRELEASSVVGVGLTGSLRKQDQMARLQQERVS